MKKFLAVFPVPKYLSLGRVACAVDYDTLRFIELRRHHGPSVTTSGLSFLQSPVDKMMNPVSDDARKAISTALARTKRNTVSLIIPEQSTYVFLIEVPLLEHKLLREAISFKLEEHVPITNAEALFEYDIISIDKIRKIVTAAVRVVPRAHVESLISLFSSDTCMVTGADTESKCLAQAITPYDGDTHMIIHIGRASTVFVIAKEGVPLFSSTLGVGSIDISEAVAKVFSVPVASVSKIRSSMRGTTAPDKRLLGALVPTLSAIRDEALKVTEYWNTHVDLETKSKVKSIFLSGQDAVFPDVMTYLELSFTIPISVADVWRNVTASKTTLPSLEFESALGFAPVIGAAIGIK